MTFFVVTIFNLGHFTCVGPMYDSDYELAILLIQLILVFKMEMTNKNIWAGFGNHFGNREITIWRNGFK